MLSRTHTAAIAWNSSLPQDLLLSLFLVPQFLVH